MGFGKVHCYPGPQASSARVSLHHDYLLPKWCSGTIARASAHGFPSPPRFLAATVLQHHGSTRLPRFSCTTTYLNGVLAPSRAPPPMVSLHHRSSLLQRFSSTTAQPAPHGFLAPRPPPTYLVFWHHCARLCPRFPFTTTGFLPQQCSSTTAHFTPMVPLHRDHLLPKQCSGTIAHISTHGFPSPPRVLALTVL